MSAVISIQGLAKTYASGLAALKKVDLDIEKGRDLRPAWTQRAGKTTLISVVCGIVTPSAARYASAATTS